MNRSTASMANSNPAENLDVHLLFLFCVVQVAAMRRADLSFRRLLLGLSVCVCVCVCVCV
jgi:hypothetical protein